MNNSKTADILHYLSLILILTVCGFLILFYEVSAYSKINEGNEIYDKTHLPTMYLNNKMRSGESVDCKNNVLIIKDGLLETHIYLYDNNLVELTTLEDDDIDKSAGEKIFAMDKFSVKKDSKRIYITYSENGITKKTVFSLRSEKHE